MVVVFDVVTDAGSGVARSLVATPVLGGRHNGHRDVRQPAQRLHEHVDAGCLHTVVVRDEHPQCRSARRRACGDRSNDGERDRQREQQAPAQAANVAERSD